MCVMTRAMLHRTLVFPFRLRNPKHGSLVTGLQGCAFTALNSMIQCAPLTRHNLYPESWLVDARFLFGVVIFFVGMAINVHSDNVLINLRKPGEKGYGAPAHAALAQHT